jgi:hypothetical protein
MAVPPADPDRYRRQQRRRALIAWAGALVVVGFLVVAIAVGGGEHHDRATALDVHYGETMTSSQYEEIEEGESRDDVLGRLDKTGRPEDLTESYVLVLFPPPEKSDICTYWEFSDEPEIFARLCFDRSSGDLTSKLRDNVHGAGGGQGTIV